MHLVPLVFGGLVCATSLAGAVINDRDRTSGRFAPPPGSIFGCTIAADGTFELSFCMQNSLYH